MGYPRWEDVSIKIQHNVSKDIYRFFVPRSISGKALLQKASGLYDLSIEECKIYYMDDEKTWVVLATDDDLHCAFNRRQKRDGPGVDYGSKPVYFLRLLLKPREAAKPKLHLQSASSIKMEATVSSPPKIGPSKVSNSGQQPCAIDGEDEMVFTQ